MKLFNLIITLTVMLMMLAACETDLPETCPDVQFTVNVNDDSTEYTVTADFEGIEDLIYGWYVDNDLKETEGLDENRDHTFDLHFTPGTYTVCLKAESAECGGSVEFCQEVTIKRHGDTDCPQPVFHKEQISTHKYLFEADFPGMDTLFYVWYVDGDSVESEPLDSERHHKFDYEFEPGEHTVCIKARTDRCGELKFCKELVIDEKGDCPELAFTAEPEGEFGYFFSATFDGKDTTQYKWYVNGEFEDKENFDGHDTNHSLYYHFEPGTHTVCIESIATDHCEVRKFCKEITIEGEHTGCPDLFFVHHNLGDNEYKFTAEFAGMHDLEWYGWYIDGELVEDEGTLNDGDHKLIKILEPGTYEVCLKTETPDCPEGISYCKEITVEATDCVDLSYTAEEVEGGYKFTADFEEKDQVTYIWKIYSDGDLLGSEERIAGSDDDHEFTWQFEPGVVYKVCLKQDGDCAETAVCNEYSID